MTAFLWTGTLLGAIVGALHALYLYRRIADRRGPAGALVYGLWAVALWTLFGAYVLAFWCLGLLGSVVTRILSRAGAAPVADSAR